MDVKRYSRRRCLYVTYPGIATRDPTFAFAQQMEAKLTVLREMSGVNFVIQGAGNEVEDVHPSSDGRFLLVKVCSNLLIFGCNCFVILFLNLVCFESIRWSIPSAEGECLE